MNTETTVAVRGTLKPTKNIKRTVPTAPSGRTLVIGMREKLQNRRLVTSAAARFANK